jgi:hypothetical protein
LKNFVEPQENNKPNALHKKHMKNVCAEIHKNKQEQEQASSSVEEHNLKPSLILKTINMKEYDTSPIKSDSKAEDFTDEVVIDSMKKRQLVKTDDDIKNKTEFKVLKVKLADGSDYALNDSKYGTKLTSTGDAYEQQTRNNTSKNIEININIDNKNPLIIVPPKSKDNIIVENGKAKHLLYGFYTSEGDFMAIGYFTTNKSGIQVSKQQYKCFEEQQENKTMDQPLENDMYKKEKAQHFVMFEQGTIIKKEDIKPVKYSTEFLETFDEKTKKTLKEPLSDFQDKATVKYEDTSGLTKENCIDICKNYDKTAEAIAKNPKTNQKHPLSPLQKTLNQENENKQKSNKIPPDVSKDLDKNEII